MPKLNKDTIAAVATAPGRGGIGVVRVSGSLASSIAQAVLGTIPPARIASFKEFKDSNGALIDQGIAIYFPHPHSYTGEDVLELQGHGGSAVMQRLLQCCLNLGARLANPGEFTQRAWLNDKLDLAQAEAVADLIEASTAEAAQSAVRSLSGVFSEYIRDLRQQLIDLRMYIEACLDFPEEDIDFISQGKVSEKLEQISSRLDAVFASASQGRLLREGLHVVLIGQPNVGKSSLLNQLSGEDIAIVTPVAGTTRDTLRNTIQIAGIPLHIIDTAGLRDTEDEVENQGILRTWKALETADIALLLVEASVGRNSNDEQILSKLPASLPLLQILNKSDLFDEPARKEERNGVVSIHLSAKTGEGLELLREHLLQFCGWQVATEGTFAARERHLQALTKVKGCLARARYNMQSPELIAEELRAAQEALNSITGEFTNDDLLGEIFSRFCIGK